MPPKKQPRKIDSYAHDGQERTNNPPAGLVTPKTDPDRGEKQTWQHDPHLDPQLQWAGKAEHTAFEIPTQSLHVHERIDPRTIIEAVRNRNGSNGRQASLFERDRDRPLREVIEFYQHAHNWSNRLIAGDSLLVMNSLLQKENMAGSVQCVYMDPPYGIRYGSNFQPFASRRDVKDGKDEDLTTEPEVIKAFRDTWELGIHSYLTYMRDRLLLARELLAESGSCFVQIGDENVHHIREIMDEVLGAENFVSLISFRTKIPLNAKNLPNIADYIVWYAKSREKLKFRRLFLPRDYGKDTQFSSVLLPDGSVIKADQVEEKGRSHARYFRLIDLMATGYQKSCHFEFELEGKIAKPNPSNSWKTTPEGMQRLIAANRVRWLKTVPGYVFYADDYPVREITNQWTDTQGASGKTYVVQTAEKIIQRCILMTTDPGDLILDPTCGSGTTAYVAEQWGRRWITCDTSRVALTLARQRLMTATFDYYQLAWPDEGVGSGFAYKKVLHITLGSIANNEPPPTETLFDQPIKDRKRARVTGPFTVEAVPSPTVQPIDDIKASSDYQADRPADATIARSGETLRQGEWRDELLKTGIRGKGGQRITFSRIEPLPCRWLHADAETRPDDSGTANLQEKPATAYQPRRAVVAFGPGHAPMEARQVENALQEAATLRPKPEIIVFAAFQFDPEAAKDIDETRWPGMTLLKAQMNADLQTDDLKKKRSSNESFWLIGQPDIEVEQIRKGNLAGQWQVHMNGFDYFNTRTGDLESGDKTRIAIWMLDTDYDGRSLYPRQVFFPMAEANGGWSKLARNLKAEIDEGLIESYKGTISLPFELGKNSRIAVKIVDDRGIESLRVIDVIPQRVK